MMEVPLYYLASPVASRPPLAQLLPELRDARRLLLVRASDAHAGLQLAWSATADEAGGPLLGYLQRLGYEVTLASPPDSGEPLLASAALIQLSLGTGLDDRQWRDLGQQLRLLPLTEN